MECFCLSLPLSDERTKEWSFKRNQLILILILDGGVTGVFIIFFL